MKKNTVEESSWDYADLSKRAKEAGGPEALTDTIYEAGRNAGRIEGAVDVAGVVAALYGMYKLFKITAPKIKKGVERLRKHWGKEAITPDELEDAKQQLIQGIEDYDAVNSTVEEN